MQNIMTNGIGVTQFNGMRPRQAITIGGITWTLRRDATDSSTMFPHQKVSWINAGSEPLGDGTVHYCWIMGVIAPTPGTLERPVNVMYVGFHPQRIMIAPNTVGQADLDRMHVYVSDSTNFAGEFVGQFLGMQPEKPVAEREAIMPWPQVPEQPKPDQKVKENDEK